MTHLVKNREVPRPIPDIGASARLSERFYQLIHAPDEMDQLYVYRLRDEVVIKPALYIGVPFPTLLDWLRDEHGGGEFRIMIRRGRVLLLSGALGICQPRVRPSMA